MTTPRDIILVTTLATLLGGSAIAVAAQSPSADASPPSTISTTSKFIPPFRYTIPATMWTRVSGRLPALQGRDRCPRGRGAAARGQGIVVIRRDGPGRCGNDPGARGIVVADVTDNYTHDCRGGGERLPVRRAPAEYIEDLQSIAGLRVKDVAETTLDGWPAVSATTTGGECEVTDVHLPSNNFIKLSIPSRIIVADVAGRRSWSMPGRGHPTNSSSWLPMAQEFIDSIDFLSERNACAPRSLGLPPQAEADSRWCGSSWSGAAQPPEPDGHAVVAHPTRYSRPIAVSRTRRRPSKSEASWTAARTRCPSALYVFSTGSSWRTRTGRPRHGMRMGSGPVIPRG